MYNIVYRSTCPVLLRSGSSSDCHIIAQKMRQQTPLECVTSLNYDHVPDIDVLWSHLLRKPRWNGMRIRSTHFGK